MTKKNDQVGVGERAIGRGAIYAAGPRSKNTKRDLAALVMARCTTISEGLMYHRMYIALSSTQSTMKKKAVGADRSI